MASHAPSLRVLWDIDLFVLHDHAPPHVHAKYQGEDGAFDIVTLALLDGTAKPRVRALVVEWAAQHQAALMQGWDRCRRGEQPDRIPPL